MPLIKATARDMAEAESIRERSDVKMRRGHMTVLDEVRRFVGRLSPDAVCDDCITEKLDLTVRQHANRKTRELAGTDGFERRKGPCGLCGEEKLVIRKQ